MKNKFKKTTFSLKNCLLCHGSQGSWPQTFPETEGSKGMWSAVLNQDLQTELIQASKQRSQRNKSGCMYTWVCCVNDSSSYTGINIWGHKFYLICFTKKVGVFLCLLPSLIYLVSLGLLTHSDQPTLKTKQIHLIAHCYIWQAFLHTFYIFML